jgi:hypothetical protein
MASTESDGRRRSTFSDGIAPVVAPLQAGIGRFRMSVIELMGATGMRPPLTGADEIAAGETIKQYLLRWSTRASSVNRVQLLARILLERQLGRALLCVLCFASHTRTRTARAPARTHANAYPHTRTQAHTCNPMAVTQRGDAYPHMVGA